MPAPRPSSPAAESHEILRPRISNCDLAKPERALQEITPENPPQDPVAGAVAHEGLATPAPDSGGVPAPTPPILCPPPASTGRVVRRTITMKSAAHSPGPGAGSGPRWIQCSWCQKVFIDGAWTKVPGQKSAPLPIGGKVTHGICPACAGRMRDAESETPNAGPPDGPPSPGGGFAGGYADEGGPVKESRLGVSFALAASGANTNSA